MSEPCKQCGGPVVESTHSGLVGSGGKGGTFEPGSWTMETCSLCGVARRADPTPAPQPPLDVLDLDEFEQSTLEDCCKQCTALRLALTLLREFAEAWDGYTAYMMDESNRLTLVEQKAIIDRLHGARRRIKVTR